MIENNLRAFTSTILVDEWRKFWWLVSCPLLIESVLQSWGWQVWKRRKFIFKAIRKKIVWGNRNKNGENVCLYKGEIILKENHPNNKQKKWLAPEYTIDPKTNDPAMYPKENRSTTQTEPLDNKNVTKKQKNKDKQNKEKTNKNNTKHLNIMYTNPDTLSNKLNEVIYTVQRFLSVFAPQCQS